MAHYFIHEIKLGSPFKAVCEMKAILSAGSERIQQSRSPKILFILDGRCGIKFVDGFKATLEGGDALFVPNPCRHYYVSLDHNTDSELYVFGIFFDYLPSKTSKKARSKLSPSDIDFKKVLAVFPKCNQHFPAIIDSSVQSLISAFRDEHYNQKIGSLVLQRNICQAILVEIARKIASGPIEPSRSNHRAQAFLAGEVKEYLWKTINRSHKLSEIAWRFRISEEHLARLFKKETGMTVMDYLRKIRVDWALTLLLSSNQTVEILAQRLGFSSSNQFCRIFKHRTGQTPSDYRRSHAGMNDPAQSYSGSRSRDRKGLKGGSV